MKNLKRGPFFTTFLSFLLILPSSVYALRALGTQESSGVLNSLRSELRTSAVPYSGQAISNGDLRVFVEREETAIKGILGYPKENSFPFYFYNFEFGGGDRTGQLMVALLKQTKLHEPLGIMEKKNRGNKDRGEVTIPVFSPAHEDLLRRFREDQTKKTDDVEFARLFRKLEDLELPRVPIRSILFFADAETLDLEFKIEGKRYQIPRGVLFWTFDDGLLAVNVTLGLDDNYGLRAASISTAIALAVAQIPEAKEEGENLRSELRSVVEKAGKLRLSESPVFELPRIPETERGESASAGAALGIHPGVAVIGGEEFFVETAEGLALTLTNFRHGAFVALEGPDEARSEARASALNKQLKASGHPPLLFASTPEEAIRLVHRQMEEQDRRAGRDRASRSEIRAILSSSSPHAEALKRQLGESQVRVMGLESFLKIASEMASRLGLDRFVNELQVKVINALRPLKSA